MIFSKIHDSSASSLDGLETTPLTRITILTTNDLHSVAHKYETLSKFVRKIQDENDVVITLDAGDWFSGSMYDRLSVSSKYSTPQLDYFEMARYDAVTLVRNMFEPEVREFY